MRLNGDTQKKSFADALFLALKNNGLLQEGVDKATENDEKQPEFDLPAELDDSERYVPKQQKVIKFKPNKSSSKNSIHYAKVALKRKPKKK